MTRSAAIRVGLDAKRTGDHQFGNVARGIIV
jgi:hypothetical protein